MAASQEGAGLAGFAALLADSTRATICLALLDGRAWTGRELADHAGVAASTASEHISRLVAGGILTECRQGRHRYVRLAGARTAEVIELLGVQAVDAPARRPASLRAATASAALARGRTCYDHLAGRLGVALTDGLVHRGLLEADEGLALNEQGRSWLLGELGVAHEDLRSARRPVTRACLDWTERRYHLAGLAGALICRRLFDKAWIRRVGTGRAVRPTPEGAGVLGELFGLDTAALVQ
jgi:DNA-binding transcriptional ArsR family regulator